LFNLHNVLFTDDALFWLESTTLHILHLFNQIFSCSIEELQRLLKDKEAYNAFFNSLDQVKTQNNVSSVARATFFVLVMLTSPEDVEILCGYDTILMLFHSVVPTSSEIPKCPYPRWCWTVGYPHTIGYRK